MAPRSRDRPPLPDPGLQRSWWLREALAAEGDPAPAPPLAGEVDADVAIIGGGYTGLWTAYFLTERAPGARIVLLEQDICGGGPSGRNGGFVHGWWENVPDLARRYGEDGALAIAREADEVVDGIGDWCAAARRRRLVHEGRLPARERLSRPGIATGTTRSRRCARWASATSSARWTPTRSSASAPRPHFATASGCGARPRSSRLAWRAGFGASSSSAASGSTRRRAFAPLSAGSGRLQLDTDDGRVFADQVVLAINAWASGWPGFRSRLLAWGSYMVATEPIPDRLAELGWTGGELLSDSRFTISYFRTTRGRPDRVRRRRRRGRLRRPHRRDLHPRPARHRPRRRQLPPPPADARRRAARGRVGRTDRHHRPPLPGDRLHPRRAVHFAHGFAGNGAGPSRLAGRILATLVDGAEPSLAALPFVGRRQPFLPPEPIRYIGARMIREALIREDDALDAGRRPAWFLKLIARIPRLFGYRLGH